MPKKYLKFEKIVDTNYQVRNNSGDFLGDIYLEKGRWFFYPTEGDVREPTWFTWECLNQVGGFMRKLEEDTKREDEHGLNTGK